MLTFVYGSHTCQPGEVELLAYNRQRIQSPRGGDMLERITLQVVVDQLQTGIAANVAGYRAFERNSQINQAGFLDDNGQRTMVWLDGDQSVSGLRILQPPSVIPQDEVEFATHLSIPITVQMDRTVAGGDQILDYEESFTFEDEGPTRVVPVETDTGPLEFYETCKFPPRFITQAGFAVGRDAPPIPNPPRIDATIVQRIRGRVSPVKQGRTHIGYRIEWRYVFVVQEELDFLPQLR
jgi:hypothetical protein